MVQLMNLQSKVTALERIMADEATICEQAKRYLGDTYLLLDTVERLYQQFVDLVGASNLCLEGIQVFAYLTCLQACRYEYLVGAAALLRGHITDSASYSRKAIEFCAFGIEIFRNLESAELWAQAGVSSGANDRYRQRFAIMDCIRKASEFMPQMKGRYNFLSNYMVHASFGSVAGRAKLTEDRRHVFDFYEFGYSDKSYAAAAFFLLMMFDLHMEIMKAFQCAISHRETSFDHSAFLSVFAVAIAELRSQKRNWIPTFKAAGIAEDFDWDSLSGS
jgi:hypothetical protein